MIRCQCQDDTMSMPRWYGMIRRWYGMILIKHLRNTYNHYKIVIVPDAVEGVVAAAGAVTDVVPGEVEVVLLLPPFLGSFGAVY